MLTAALVLEWLQPLSTVEGYTAAEAFLQKPGTRLHESGGDSRVTVKQTRDIWSHRLDRVQKGIIQPIPGLEHLVSSLQCLPSDTIIKGIIFENEGAIGVYWFDNQIGSPVGFVVCERTADLNQRNFDENRLRGSP